MKDLNMVNIACWSIGEHAQRNILPAILETPELELRGIFTRNINTQKKVIDSYGCINYETEEAMLNDSSVHAIYISSPNGCHFQQIKRCLESGKSVLVEKTAITNLSDAEFIVQLAKEKNLIVMEAFMYLFHAQFQTLKSLIFERVYGKVLRIHCDFGFPHLPKENIRYQLFLEGGALFDAGAYTLSAARALLTGNINVLGSAIFTEEEYEVDTKGFAMLQGESPAVAHCSWAFGGSYINNISVWCEHAHLIVERAFSKPPTFDSNITVSINGNISKIYTTGKDNHFIRMLSFFAGELKLGRDSTALNELLQQAKLIEDLKLKSSTNNV